MTQPLTINPPLTIRSHCQKLSESYTGTIPDNKFGATLGHINGALQQYSPDGTDQLKYNRRLVHTFLFAPDYKPFDPGSASLLTHGQRYALQRWVGAVFTEGWDWVPRPAFKQEAYHVLAVALWIHALTLQNNGGVSFGTLLEGYKTEVAMLSSDDPDYWVGLAIELKDKQEIK